MNSCRCHVRVRRLDDDWEAPPKLINAFRPADWWFDVVRLSDSETVGVVSHELILIRALDLTAAWKGSLQVGLPALGVPAANPQCLFLGFRGLFVRNYELESRGLGWRA